MQGLLELAVFPRTESYGEIIGFASACEFACICRVSDRFADTGAFADGLTASWMVSLLPPALSQLFGVEGLATMSGFMVLCSAPGQFVGPTLGGLVLSASNHSWAAMSYYGGGTMILGSIILCYGTCLGLVVWARVVLLRRASSTHLSFAARFSRESRLLIKF